MFCFYPICESLNTYLALTTLWQSACEIFNLVIIAGIIAVINYFAFGGEHIGDGPSFCIVDRWCGQCH